ncbi:MAG: class I SAM-dependent methyltransferase [candidate division Zixibacteria bacterium]|nr:class I SAM-dependent methyltransferase [candidate division Zixibacteria bacterium]
MKIFHPRGRAIELALNKLKQDGVVHPEAQFNYEAEDGLRREVTYRDDDLQYRLGRSPAEVEVVDTALEMLISMKLVSTDAGYNKQSFDSLRFAVKKEFKGSWTSITPVMERLLYMLTAVKRPKRLVELGSFWGNTLAWFAGPCVGRNREYQAERIYGIDIDMKMTELAKENFARLEKTESVELIGEDAAVTLERIDAPIDFLYLEAKDENCNSGYLEFLQQVYDKLPEGSWVIAHDTTAYDHQDDLREYLVWVRDVRNFSESISFDVDRFGLELSIK